MSELRHEADPGGRTGADRSPPSPSLPRRAARRFFDYKPAGTIVALVLLCAVWAATTPFFLRSDNLLDITRQMSVLGLMAIGVTFVLIAGQIDLSVGATYGLTLVVFAMLVKREVPVLAAFVLCLALGAVIGLVNGVLVSRLRLPSFIVTLGMLQLLRGLALILTGGLPVTLFGIDATGFDVFLFLGQGRLFGVLPMQFVVLIVVAVIAGFVLRRTTLGLRIYSVGSSPRAALLAGIPVARVQTVAFVISGMLAALGGLLALGFLPTANPTAGSGLEFDVFAAAVLGGVSLFGGSEPSSARCSARRCSPCCATAWWYSGSVRTPRRPSPAYW